MDIFKGILHDMPSYREMKPTDLTRNRRLVVSRASPDDSISVKIQVFGQAVIYLDDCNEAEFHRLRGEILPIANRNRDR